MTAPSARTRLRRPAVALLCAPAIAFLLALVVFEITSQGTWAVDTTELVGGTGVADHCLRAGDLTGCGLTPRFYCNASACAPARHYTTVGPFPLLQYLPALALKRVGASPLGAINGLVAVSGVACLLLLLLSIEVLRRLGPGPAALLALCLLTGPLLWYSHAAFGEGLAAVLLAAFTIALIRADHPVLVALLACLAALTKETSIPFLVAIAVIVWLAQSGRPARGQVIAVAAGLVLGLAATAAFNLFRFDSPFNLFYGQALFRTPWSHRPEFFAALFASPTGGLIWFWPAAIALFVAALAIAVARAGWSRRLLREPAVHVFVLLLVLQAGLATWYSPFGAAAWGPRLTIAWLPALLLILVWAYGQELIRGAARHRIVTLAVCAVVALAGAASLGALLESSHHRHGYPNWALDSGEIAYRGSETAATPSAACPGIAIIQVDPKGYYACAHTMWSRDPIVTTAFSWLWRNDAPIALLYVLALAGLAGVIIRAPDADRALGSRTWAPPAESQ